MSDYIELTPEELREHKAKISKNIGLSTYEPALGEDISSPSAMGEAVGLAAEAVDIPASMLRAGAYGALDEDSSMSEEISKQYQRIKEGDSEYGPSGKDVVMAAGMEDGTMADLAGVGAEMVLDPASLVGAGVGLTKAAKNIGKSAGESIKKLSKTPSSRVFAEHTSASKYGKEGVRPELLAEAGIQEDLIKYIDKPSKLLEAIEGPKRIVYPNQLQSGKKSIKMEKVKGKSGKLGEISDELEAMINTISNTTFRGTDVDTKYIVDPISAKKIDKMEDPLSGVPFSLDEAAQAEEYIDSIMRKGKKSFNLKELFDLKKELGKRVSSREFWKNPDDATAVKKEATIDLINQIDGVIEKALDGVPIRTDNGIDNAAEVYKVQNDRLHKLMQIRGLLNSVPPKELKDVNVPQILMESGLAGAALGTGAMLGSGSPTAAFISGAAGSAAWAMRDRGRSLTDAFLAKNLDKAGKAAEKAVPFSGGLLPQIIRETKDEPIEVKTPYVQDIMRGLPNKREPQSFMSPRQRLEMKEFNLPKALLESKIPRTSKGLQENAQLFKMKVAQEAENIVADRMNASGADPEMADPAEIRDAAKQLYTQVTILLDERPQDIPKMLPVFASQMPHFFEDDAYNRIEGVVPMSLRPKVRDDIRKNSSLTSRQKMAKVDLLNRTGEYFDDDQDSGMA